MIQAPFRNLRMRALTGVAVTLFVAGCDPASLAEADAPPEPGVLEATRVGPAGAADGTCWGKTVTPAVVQTVTKQEQIKPAVVNEDGTIGAPPKYRSTTTQEIVSARRDNWFETPCKEVLTPELISSLQRALFARGLYAGSISGEMNADTRAAIRRLQAKAGTNSPVLMLETAQNLGLIAVARPLSP